MCEGVEEELQEYRFTRLGDSGQEREDTATIATVRDISISALMTNIDEPWVQGHVVLR